MQVWEEQPTPQFIGGGVASSGFVLWAPPDYNWAYSLFPTMWLLYSLPWGCFPAQYVAYCKLNPVKKENTKQNTSPVKEIS